MEVDYLIIGQGIAGTMFSYFAKQNNQTFFIIDKQNKHSASNIATGIVNPITGRRMVKSWMIDDLQPYAIEIYKKLELELDTKFLFEENIYKIFSSDFDTTEWNNKKNDIEYKDFLGDIFFDNNENISNDFGVGAIKKCFWVDVPILIKKYREKLLQNNQIVDEIFDYNLIDSKKSMYKNIKFKNIIFAEGYQAKDNPFFNFIPFTLAKGEIFTIKSEALKVEKIYNKNIFLLPIGNHLYKVGATFIWNDLEEKVTEKGKAEIIEKLQKIIKTDFEIIDEKVGIRPTVKDRRPVLGNHTTHKNIFIFGGFGTKGVSLSPYFANYLLLAILQETAIMPAINVNRFL